MTTSYPFKNFGLNRNRAIINTTDPSQDAGLGAARNTVGPGGGGIKRPVSPPIVHAQLDPATAVTISATPDGNGNYLAAGSTSALTDDAGLGQTAAWNGLTSIPAGVQSAIAASAVQPALGAAGGSNYILMQSGAGGSSWAPQYGFNFNSAYTVLATTDLSLNSMVTIGNAVRLPNPGVPCTIFAIASGGYGATGTVTSNPGYNGQIGISTNGGGAYTFSPPINLTDTVTGQGGVIPISGSFCIPNVTPTGDIQVEFQAEYTAGTTTGVFAFFKGALIVFMMPVANFSLVTGPLAVAVPGTETTSASSYYPTTTSTAYASITATPTGGTPGYTYAWTRTGGTGAGTIVSGATAITCNVAGTETGTAGGSAYTDIYECVVTDSVSSTANASCTITSTYYLYYNTIVPSMYATDGMCSTGTAPGSCQASGTFSVSATGGNGSYTYSNTITSQTGGYSATITSGATSATGAYSGTHVTTLPGNADTVNFQTSVNDTRSTGAQLATATGRLTYRYTS